MISITTTVHFDVWSDGVSQFVMTLPFMIGFVSLQFIAETASLLTAISELNFEVVCKCLALDHSFCASRDWCCFLNFR